MGEPEALTRTTVEAVWRVEAPRLIGGLVRFVRDIDLAQDLAQEALVAALERWPTTGIPDNPGAWLMTAAKRRAVDAARRPAMMDGKHRQIDRNAARWTVLAWEVDRSEERAREGRAHDRQRARAGPSAGARRGLHRRQSRSGTAG